MKNVEIERKWMVRGWPNNLELLYVEKMRQGYISTSPTVRIRDEDSKYILCFKSKGKLSRKEIEMEIPKDKFDELEDLIGLPLIDKIRKTYLLNDGHHLEVNFVDVNLGDYLDDEVTYQKGQSMAAYWIETRVNK